MIFFLVFIDVPDSVSAVGKQIKVGINYYLKKNSPGLSVFIQFE